MIVFEGIMKHIYRYLLLLFLLAGQVFAQSADKKQSLTLDETLKFLLSSDKNAKKEFRWDPLFQEGSFLIEGHFGVFPASSSAGKNGIFMLGRDIYDVPLPFLVNGELLFPQQFVNTVHEAFENKIMQDASRFRVAAILIDPGHGGSDPGATIPMTIRGKKITLNDKDFALKSSLFLRDMLVQKYPDKQILMTRDKDIRVELDDRANYANSIPAKKNEAVLFISLHANISRTNKNARGYEVFYLSPNHRRNVLNSSEFQNTENINAVLNILTEEAIITESMRLAESILDSLGTEMGNIIPSRGLKNDVFYVMRKSLMPAVLIELGFMSNTEDALVLTDDTLLKKMSLAIFHGIEDYITIFEGSGGLIFTP